ncbi:MAG: hypothetical protein ABIO49_16045, partial [Dokdonella sp.]
MAVSDARKRGFIRFFSVSVRSIRPNSDFGQVTPTQRHAYDGRMSWPHFNHIQLLRYAGLFQYASVG